jgi:hypothetical protein
MRFCPDWLTATAAHLDCGDNLLLCGQCLGLDSNNMDIRKPNKIYNGAKMIVSDPTAEPRYRVLNPKWADDRPGKDGYRLSAVMGALYAFHRPFYLSHGGLEFLRGWGCDEAALSLKTILCGGEIRMCKGLRAGHKFRYAGQRIPYRADPVEFYYNVIMLAYQCCPTEVFLELIDVLGDSPVVQSGLRLFQDRLPNRDDSPWMPATRSWQEYLELIKEIDAP